MPILNVEIVGNVESKEKLAQKIADKAGEILKMPAGRTWVKLHFLDRHSYAENDSAFDVKPVFVTLIKKDELQLSEKEIIAEKFAVEFAKIIGRPKDCVHTHFMPPGKGQLAFGGKIL